MYPFKKRLHIEIHVASYATQSVSEEVLNDAERRQHTSLTLINAKTHPFS